MTKKNKVSSAPGKETTVNSFQENIKLTLCFPWMQKARRTDGTRKSWQTEGIRAGKETRASHAHRHIITGKDKSSVNANANKSENNHQRQTVKWKNDASQIRTCDYDFWKIWVSEYTQPRTHECTSWSRTQQDTMRVPFPSATCSPCFQTHSLTRVKRYFTCWREEKQMTTYIFQVTTDQLSLNFLIM